MLADETLRRDLHRRMVERLGDAPGAAALESQIGAAINDAIEIVALGRGEARVEVIRRHLGREDRNRMRPQMRVQGVAHRVGVPRLGEIEMTDLSERVHAGVGAPGAVDAHFSPQNASTAAASTPCTEGRCPGSASRRTACRRIRW